MKKSWIILNCVMVLAILLTACGSKNNAGAASTDSAVTTNQNGEFKLPLQTQLIIGTFALEKSDYVGNKRASPGTFTIMEGFKKSFNERFSFEC